MSSATTIVTTTIMATALPTSVDGGQSGGVATENFYGMIPSHAANMAGIILFGIMWGFQCGLSLYHRQWWFFTAWFCGIGLECSGYVGRFRSSTDPDGLTNFLLQIINLTLGPAFLMGGVYYQLAKMAVVYGTQYSPLQPMHYSILFMACDFVSIVIQAIGGGMAATAVEKAKNTSPGTHIMLAGIIFQVVSMAVFMILLGWFLWNIFNAYRQHKPFDTNYSHIQQKPFFKLFPYAIFFCSICIFIRCVYRACELSEGWTGYLIVHERYFLVMDGLCVFLGVLSLTIVHPGFALGTTHINVLTSKGRMGKLGPLLQEHDPSSQPTGDHEPVNSSSETPTSDISRSNTAEKNYPPDV